MDIHLIKEFFSNKKEHLNGIKNELDLNMIVGVTSGYTILLQLILSVIMTYISFQRTKNMNIKIRVALGVFAFVFPVFYGIFDLIAFTGLKKHL